MRRSFLILGLLAAMPLRAVIVSGGDGSGNTTSSGAGDGWNYVGSIGGASGVYLGEVNGSYWVLTAAHVGAGSFTLDGTSYSQVGSAFSLTNSSGLPIDMVLYRIDGNAALPPALSLSDSTPALGERVTMIGNGVNRGTSETYWNFNWQETSNSFLGNYKGYKWTGTYAKRWGQNTANGATVVQGNTTYFTTTFAQGSGSAQATVGDSGGGVFVFRNGAWELAGIMGLVSTTSNQPASTSIYGGMTYSADIATYRTQILNIMNTTAPIPEPGVLSLLWLAGGVGTALALRRRF